tara:strand:- start:15660 stop:17015 length:1356 start_codon:yes stop_codon:yes gene_type:complete
MGGKGLRFAKTGLSIPKPLITIDNKTTISRVLDSIKMSGNFIFVHRQDHCDSHLIDKVINSERKGLNYYITEDNEGQVQTCLAAKESIDTDEPLIIINCDNYLVWDPDSLTPLLNDPLIDGAAFTFNDPQRRTHWCFAEVGEDNNIVNLVEKKPISDIALAGAFFWKKGSDFVKFAQKLIESDQRASNGEFYLGAVFALAIQNGKKILNHPIEDMQSLGSPEDMELFKDWIKTKNDHSQINNPSTIMDNRKFLTALDELRRGKPIVLVDEYDRENEGDIVLAAETLTPDSLLFAMNEAGGLMCIPCAEDILDRLDLPPMVANNTDSNETPFTVSVDAAEGTTTGMSLNDRLATIKVFLDPHAKPSDLNRPGHLFPLRACNDLLRKRRGHTEGSIELMKLAGLKPVAIIVEMMNKDGSMSKGPEITSFAVNHNLSILSTEEVYEAAYNESLQ